MGLWNRWNVCKYFLRVSHRSLWITFFLFSIYYNITCFENIFFLGSSSMERSLTLLFTCIRSVLGKKSDQTPITDFCRLSNCRHWLLIFCTIHHRTSVREKNYKKNVFLNLCFSVFLFLKSFPFQSGKRGGHHPLAHFSGIPYLFRQKDKKCLNPPWQILIDKNIGWGKFNCGGRFHTC